MVSFGVSLLGGCSECANDLDELPIVSCEPVPAGSAGCHGLPGDDPATATKIYPLACGVRAPFKWATCGYGDFTCTNAAADGGTVYSWVVGL
jgi:hypothetical protein